MTCPLRTPPDAGHERKKRRGLTEGKLILYTEGQTTVFESRPAEYTNIPVLSGAVLLRAAMRVGLAPLRSASPTGGIDGRREGNKKKKTGGGEDEENGLCATLPNAHYSVTWAARFFEIGGVLERFGGQVAAPGFGKTCEASLSGDKETPLPAVDQYFLYLQVVRYNGSISPLAGRTSLPPFHVVLSRLQLAWKTIKACCVAASASRRLMDGWIKACVNSVSRSWCDVPSPVALSAAADLRLKNAAAQLSLARVVKIMARYYAWAVHPC